LFQCVGRSSLALTGGDAASAQTGFDPGKKVGKLNRSTRKNQAGARRGSTLSLLVARFRTDNPDNAVALDDLALAANAFY
jgi:hypothetical protein